MLGDRATSIKKEKKALFFWSEGDGFGCKPPLCPLLSCS